MKYPCKEKYCRTFIQEVVDGRGLPGLAARLSAIIGLPVIITNSWWRIVGFQDPQLQSSPHPFITWAGEGQPAKSHLENPQAEFFAGIQWDQESREALVFPLLHQRATVGYVFVLQDGNWSREKSGVVEGLKHVAVLQLLHQRELELLEQRYQVDFVYDLLYNNFDTLDTVVQRGRLWNWDLTRPHLLVIFEIEEYDGHTDGALFKNLLESVQYIAKKREEHAIILERSDQIVLLFPLKQDMAASELEDMTGRLLKEIKDTFRYRYPKRSLNVGVGRVYPTVSELYRSYQEAKTALSLGFGAVGDDGVFYFSRMGVMRLLYTHDRQELKEFMVETLGPLIRHDQENHSELLGTLHAWFEANGDIKEAANLLFVHPNTLRYRLSKVEEILGISLQDMEAAMELHIALKIALLNGVEATS